jgi:hypothetical protein
MLPPFCPAMWNSDFLGRSFLIQLTGRTHFSGLQIDPSFSSTPDELASLADLLQQVTSMNLVNEASKMIRHLIRTNVSKLVISSAQFVQMVTSGRLSRPKRCA